VKNSAARPRLKVSADLAAAVAGGADCIDGVGRRCGDREHAFGAAASTTTMWRLVDDKIDAAHLSGIRAARGPPRARQQAWAAGAAPDPDDWLHVDIDATITIDHSDRKEQAAPTWMETFGHHGLFAFLDCPAIAGAEGLAGLLRRGNAGSNTAADHVSVLDSAMESLPPQYRPDPADHDGPKILVRCDAAGATHTFAQHCRTTGVGFSFGYAVDVRVRAMPLSVIPGQLAGLELRHRQHARVDRIGEAKATDCATCPVTAPRPTLPGWRSSWPQPIWSHGRS
jgi:hypothetical protein